jgi:uncharacterized protein YjbJ (UPF0337 family)
MVDTQTLKGHWKEITGKLQEKWGQLTGDDLQQFDGSATQLVGLIQRKTGESRESIEQFLDDATTQASGMIAKASDTAREYAGQAREYAQQATESLRDQAGRVSERVREGYSSAESMVQQRPMESAAVAFTAGLITGVVIGLVMRSR